MNIYLDTCIISGLAKEDLPDLELEALIIILNSYKMKKINLVTSLTTIQEVNKLPPQVRRKHEFIYLLV